MRNIVQFLLIMGLGVSTASAADPRQEYREEIRDWVRAHAAKIYPTIGPEENDRAADLVDKLEITNLAAMEERGLISAELANSPWTDSYWPTYAGHIANRYLDPDYDAATVWKNNYEYLTGHVGRGEIKKMSPAEKYDLLVGDGAFTLTRNSIMAGAPHADGKGEVALWFGLCHGWAPASFMLPRPTKAVTAKGAKGEDILFTPSDMKALATLAWANGAGETKFIGGRCNEKEPGDVPSPECADTNPATWHLAVVNQIGINKRSFVMDVSSGFEVWNQPIFGYEYWYANPETRKASKTLAGARMRLRDLKEDRFKARRARAAEYVVRVEMMVTYVTESNPPSRRLTDGPDDDTHLSVKFTYELELDADNGIVGGEWLTATHPDFLWLPVLGSKAESVGDTWLESRRDRSSWKKGEALPLSWREAALASSGHDQPLARVVEELLQRANGR